MLRSSFTAVSYIRKGLKFDKLRSQIAHKKVFKSYRAFATTSEQNVKNSSEAASSDKEFKQADDMELKKAGNYRDKVKLLWRKYGLMLVGTYFSIYGLTLSGFYFTLDAGLLNASTIGLEKAEVIHKVEHIIV